MMKHKDFAVFILTHGRPDNVITYKTLEKHGYTGEICIIIDNEDKTADKYRENFGDKVIMFDKKAIASTFDEGDNFDDRRAIVYARNACWDIAKELGIKYFMQLDDDYHRFLYKFDENNNYKESSVINLNNIIKILLDFYKNNYLLSVAMAQNGDFIGGKNGSAVKSPRFRKIMNTFICSTDRPFQFIGRINEDVNTYTNLGSRGGCFLSTPLLSIIQAQTQSNNGGMTDIYRDSGTYIKSFYTIIFSPSCTKIRMMGVSHRRLHHQITWKHAVPCIINEKFKKTSTSTT